MQTFLPLPSFQESAQCLDRQRLGKQRVEVLQILNTLLGKSKGWKNHPNVKMWQGYEFTLVLYGKAICQEWKKRGYKDTCEEKIQALWEDRIKGLNAEELCEVCKYPQWLTKEFCRGHRQLLLEKDFAFYSKKFDIC